MTGRTLADAVIAVRPDFSRATAGADAAGRQAGQKYADGFSRDSAGKLRQANGRLATDAQKAALEAGGKAGTGFGTQFGDKFAGKTKSVLADWSKQAGRFLLPVGIGAAILQIGKIGTAYEDNLNIFQSVTRATGVEMGKVADKARQLGADVKLPGVSAAGAAEAMTELAKSGLSVEQAMDAARGTLQLARAASISEAQAAEITGNAINAFGLKAKDTTFVVDELAAAANSSSIEIGDASASFKMAAAVFSGFQGKVVGPKEAITELNTAIAVLGNNGIKGSDAGTSLKQMLLQLTGPSQSAKDAMKLLSYESQGATISLEQQTQILQGNRKERTAGLVEIENHNKNLKLEGDIAYDSSGKMRSLRDILKLTAAGTKGMNDETRNMALTTIFGADATRSVIALLKGGLPVYDAQRKAVLQVGAASDVAAAKNKGLKGAIDNVRSQVENAAIAIYNSVKGPLTKSLNDFAGILSDTFDFIGNHIGLIKDMAQAVGILAAAFYGYRAVLILVTATQKAWIALQAVIAFVQLASEVRSFAAAWALLDAAMAANPIGIVVIAIAALVAGIIFAWKHSETFRTVVLAVWGAIKTAVGATIAWFTNTVWPALVAVWNGIAAAAKWAFNNVIMPVVRDLVAFFRNVVAPVFTWLWHNIIEPAWKAISWIIHTYSAIIQLEVAIVVAFFRNVVGPVFLWLWHNIIEPVWRGIRAVVSVAAGQVRTIVDGLVRFFRTYVGPVFTWLWHNVIEPVWNGIRTAIKAAWDFIKPILTSLGNFVKVNLLGMFQGGIKAIKAVWEGLKETIKAPVVFAVRYVINPLIDGFDKIARTFHTPEIHRIDGLEEGGRIPGPPSRRDNMLAALMHRGEPAGTIAVATGEFITNTDSSEANAGLLGAVNRKRGKVGLTDVLPFLGGFEDGGGISGFFGKIWNGIKGVGSVVSNPGAALSKLAAGALNRIPGAGGFVDIMKGMGQAVIDGIKNLLASLLPGGGGGASSIAANGSPPFPPWPSSPGASRGDSGVWRNIVALIKSTGPVSGSFGNSYRPGDPLWHGSGRAVDWMGYNQDSLASFLAAHRPLELIHRSKQRDYAYTRGVNKGSFNETLMEEHRNHVHIAMAGGGLVKLAKIASADYGAVTLNQGHNLIYNGTGKPEPLVSPNSGPSRMHPDDIAALASAMGQVIGGVLLGTIPAARAAGRQVGRRPN